MNQKIFKAVGRVGEWHRTKPKPYLNYFPQTHKEPTIALHVLKETHNPMINTMRIKQAKVVKAIVGKHRKVSATEVHARICLRENSNDKLSQGRCGIQKTFNSHTQEKEFAKQGRLAALQLAG